ncbi:hypothetical protein ONZ45_g16419 [Pleurotus djamor]|nr:hypothetical protein ONZ45_g16419 [Pleurotus djamor]
MDPVTYDLWHSILPSFTNVKTMTLAMFDLKILEIITPSIGSESATELPKLETLILSGYTFGNSANDLLSFMTDPTPLSVLLGSRRIDTVKVVDSLVTLDLVDQFRNRNIEIEWGNTTILDTRPVRDAFKAFYTELLCKLEG